MDKNFSKGTKNEWVIKQARDYIHIYGKVNIREESSS